MVSCRARGQGSQWRCTKTPMRSLVIGVFDTVAAGHSVTTSFLCSVRVRFVAAVHFQSPCKSCVSQMQFAATQIPTPYGHKYRLFMDSDTDRLWSVRVEHTDAFWSVLPIGYEQEYRWIMVSFTDRLWSVFGMNFLQIRLKSNVPGTCSVCMFV